MPVIAPIQPDRFMDMYESLSATILACDPPTLEAMQRLAQSVAGIELAVSQCGAVSDAQTLLRTHPSDMLFVSCSPSDADQTAAFVSLGVAHPEVDLVLFVTELTSSTLQAALRIGAREVIALGSPVSELQSAVNRISFRRQAARTHRGRMLSFISCKGGSGATFICANLAYAMASMTSKRVLLIDLNLQFGDAILYLSDARPTSTVADVVGDVQRLDAALLKASVVQILPNFGLLPAPLDPSSAAGVNPKDIGDLLRFAKTQADLVLVDLGRKLDASSLEALDLSDSIHLVVQQTLPYIRDARRMLDLFRTLGYTADKLRLVLSRFDRDADIGLEDLQDALGAPIFASLPNDYKVASASVNQGIPVQKLAPSSPVARGFAEFAVKLGAPSQLDASWFRRVLKRA